MCSRTTTGRQPLSRPLSGEGPYYGQERVVLAPRVPRAVVQTRVVTEMFCDEVRVARSVAVEELEGLLGLQLRDD